MSDKYSDQLLNFYRKSPMGFGALDIYCFGTTDPYVRIGKLLAVIGGMQNTAGQFGISEIIIVLPSYQHAQAPYVKTRILESAANAIDEVFKNTWKEPDKSALFEYVRVICSANMECRTAIEVIDSSKPDSVVLFLEAAFYRDNKLTASGRSDKNVPSLSEDVWPTHLQTFAILALVEAKNKPCYVVLDAGLGFPVQPKNRDVLMSVDGTGVVVESARDDVRQIFASNVADWQMKIESGQLGDVLNSIDRLPRSFDVQKPFVKIQLLAQAKMHAQALELIHQELDKRQDFDPDLTTKLAKISCDGGDYELAMSLMVGVIPQLTTQESIRVALLVSSRLNDRNMDNLCFKRLKELYPNSSFVGTQQISRLLNARDYNGLLAELAGKDCPLDPEKAAALAYVVSRLSTVEETVYSDVIIEIKKRWPIFAQRAYLICIDDALALSRLDEVLFLSRSLDMHGGLIRESVLSLTNALERLLLGVSEGTDSRIEIEELRGIFFKIIEYVSRNPTDSVCRNALTNLFSVPVAGSWGLPVIVVITIDLARSIDSSRESTSKEGENTHCSDEEIFTQLKEAYTWMAERAPIILGKAKLPDGMFSVSDHTVFLRIQDILHESGKNLSSSSEIAVFEDFVAVGVLVTSRSDNPSKALQILQLGSSYLALSGAVQRARDLIEIVFEIAGDDSYLLRLGWFSVADVYHRLGMIDKALIAMSNALCITVSITREDAWAETYLLMRLFRDLHFGKEARSLMPTGRALLESLGILDLNECRLESMDQSIRLLDLLGDPDPSFEDVENVAATAASRIQMAMKTSEEVAPAVMLIAQVIRLAELRGIPIAPEATVALNSATATLGEPFASIVRALQVRSPTSGQVSSLLKRLEKSRYSDDIGFDIQQPVLLSRRLLDSDEAEHDPHVAAFATEILADHAISLPKVKGVTVGMTEALLSEVHSTGEYAKQISNDGITVVMLGISESGDLIRVIARNGCLESTEREAKTVFAEERLGLWERDFPYKYGAMDDAFNGFRMSMQGIGFTFDTSQPTLLVMDTKLQKLPPNMLLLGDATLERDVFIGTQVPVGVVPSLSWLLSSRENSSMNRTGLHSWISTSGKGKGGSALKILKERLHDTFIEHALSTNTDPNIPDSLAGAEMVVIGAHGGLDMDRRFFHVISDEDDLRLNSDALADALRDVGLVILFVCSGGRLDSHPSSHTVVGLTKQLLNAGCSTVVASPWPLEVTVASNWLPVFLRLWLSGETAMNANFHANQAVLKALGDSPSKCLAMSVFGNPFFKRKAIKKWGV